MVPPLHKITIVWLCSVITSNFSSESGGGPLIETEQNLVLTWHLLQYPIHILTHLPPALFSDNHPLLQDSPQMTWPRCSGSVSALFVRMLLAAAELRQQTTCPLTLSTLAPPTPTLMGSTLACVQWLTVLSLSQSLLAYNSSISCPCRVCLAAIMSW